MKKICFICKHIKSEHNKLGCMDCFVGDQLINDGPISLEYNHQFKQDNLKYLEQLYEKKVQHGG